MMRSRLLVATALVAASASAQAASFLPYFTPEPAQMKVESGWTITGLVTVGETLPNGYQPVGIMDGIGAYSLDGKTIRAFVSHELAGSRGYAYSLSNGTSLTGARISYFDIDKKTLGVVNAGQAISSIIDRFGTEVTDSAQIGGGLNRLCSSVLVERHQFGQGRGLTDRLYLSGEETSNGSAFALDPETGTMHAVPWLGRAAFENVSVIDTGVKNKVGVVISDDSAASPLYLYVGEKQTNGGILERNGLVGGKLYAWKSDAGDADPRTFNGANGDTRGGTWVELTVRDASKAGEPGYDAQGFADQATLKAEAAEKGAFLFSRPEDVAVNPENGQLIAFASTGLSNFADGADTWGTLYTIAFDFDAEGNPVSGQTTIVYNGNTDPTYALRSPDNLDWAGADKIMVQEDRSADWASVASINPNESSLLEVGLDGSVTRVATIDRSAVPAGQVDSDPLDVGDWENSGIVDISALLGLDAGTAFLGDVQAHSIKLGNGALVEGGQLFLLRAGAVPEPASWAMMIMGFGVIGMAARRRRALVSA